MVSGLFLLFREYKILEILILFFFASVNFSKNLLFFLSNANISELYQHKILANDSISRPVKFMSIKRTQKFLCLLSLRQYKILFICLGIKFLFS